MHFHNHMIETEAEHIDRVSKKISKVLLDEGLVFDVQMIPQIRMVAMPKPKEVKEKQDDSATK